MSKIYTSMLQLIGNTPLLKPERYNNAAGVAANLLVKLDAFNPAGSAKDRIAKAMIEDAEKKGILKEGSVIIEPTSGNTGIGLAAVAAAKGYRAIFTMPETMSIERRNLISAYGAEIVLTPGKTGMKGAVDKANELAKEIPDSFIPGQFTNPVNPPDDRPGNLRRYRRRCRHLLSWCRHRRYPLRRRPVPQRKETVCPDHRYRTERFAAPLRRPCRPA